VGVDKRSVFDSGQSTDAEGARRRGEDSSMTADEHADVLVEMWRSPSFGPLNHQIPHPTIEAHGPPEYRALAITGARQEPDLP
jgi:hypothetical protein